MVQEGTIDCFIVHRIDYTIPTYLSFVITGVYGGTRACVKYRERCSDPWGD